VSQVITYN